MQSGTLGHRDIARSGYFKLELEHIRIVKAEVTEFLLVSRAKVFPFMQFLAP
jgi:hypothetical protein